MYQKLFSGSVFVIKVSGKVFEPPYLVWLLQDIALIHKTGIKIILVHGCGHQIDAKLQKRGEEIKKDNGVRITTFSAMEVVKELAQEWTNKIIVQLKKEGCEAQGNFESSIIARRVSRDNCTGKITRIKRRALKELLKKGIAVISPLGVDKKGCFLNINADHAAFALAVAFKAAKLIFVTDVSGVYGKRGMISELTAKEAEMLLQKNIIIGGMVPKILSCIEALSEGVSRITILSGFQKGALLKEIFTKKGCGTMITR